MILCMPRPTDQALRLLRSLIDRIPDMSVRAAAKLIDMDNTVLQDWYNGDRRPRAAKSIERLESVVDALEEFEKKNRPTNDDDLKKVGIRLVKLVDKVVADDRLPVTAEKMIEVMDWGSSSERYGFVVPDDAMEEDLHPRQKIIADDSISVDPNMVCLIETTDGERMVRVAQGVGSSLVFRANDSQYPPYPISKAKVMGVVVEVITDLPGGERTRHEYPHGMRRKK